MIGNRQDYVYNLAAAVRALAPEAYDSHLFALEVRLYILSPLHTFFCCLGELTKHDSIAFFLPLLGATTRLGSSIGINRRNRMTSFYKLPSQRTETELK